MNRNSREEQIETLEAETHVLCECRIKPLDLIKPLDSLDLIKPLDLFALWLRQDARTLVNA